MKKMIYVGRKQLYAFFIVLALMYNVFMVFSAAPNPGHGADTVGPGTFSGTSTDIWSFPGNVGIGTTSPGDILHVSGGDIRLDSGYELYFVDNGQIRSLDDNHRILFRRSENKMELREFGDIIFDTGTTSGEDMRIVGSNGNVGIGTTAPNAKLEVAGDIMSQRWAPKYTTWSGIGDGGAAIVNSNEASYKALMIVGSDQATGFGRVVKVWDSLQVQGTLFTTGNVGIGTTSPSFGLDVRGNNGWIGSGDSSQSTGGWRLGKWPAQGANTWVYLSRADSAVYQDLAIGALWAGGSLRFGTSDDLAEMTPADSMANLTPGDVVIIDDRVEEVRITKSSSAYDPKVAGVISDPETTALMIGGSHPSDVNRSDVKPLAISGRVLTQVSTRNGVIRKGDLLTTSYLPGHAMKATKQGFTLGKALESFEAGPNGETTGKIWVLVDLSWYGGEVDELSELKAENEEIRKRIQDLEDMVKG